MTRPTASGLPFLILRSDSGKYAYWRNLPKEHAAIAKGTIDLSWALKSHLLDGKRVIKISLKTGDLTLAQRRWSDVHAQIEALIERGIVSAKNEVGPVASPIASLTSGDRAAIAAQARHDVLADHDADWTDPETLSPLARGLEQALLRRDAGRLISNGEQAGGFNIAGLLNFLERFPRGMTLTQIREAARAMEADNVARMLSSGRTWPLDGPPALTEEFAQDPDSPSGERVVDSYSTPSELTTRLAENGYDLSDETERRKVAHAVLVAKATAYQDVGQRRNGVAIETPPRPAPLIADEKGEVFPTILEMHDIWSDRVKPDRKTKDDNRLYVERFISMHGNLKVDEITRKHIRDFRDKLKKFPAAMPAHVSKRPFLQIVEWAEKNDPPRLSPVTVNQKGLGALSTLMQLAVNEYDLPGDPSSGLRLPVTKADVLDRHPFTPALLAKFPPSPVFQNPPKVSKGGCGAAAFWLPLISLYAGARLEEIGQLPLSDIHCESRISYFWFRDDDDEDGEEKPRKMGRRRSAEKSEEDKSIKSKAGRRRVPFHPVLIELGLPEYIAARHTAGDKMLFPQLNPYRGRCTKNWSRWFGRYLNKYVTDDPAFVFHSFRHSFIGAMRRKGIRLDFMKALVGHARELELDLKDFKDVTEEYGDAVPISILNNVVQQVDYPGLKFDRIEAFLR